MDPARLASDLSQGDRAPMTDYCSPSKPGLDGLFDCNICLETASEPIVTLCGHLYCWGCIYKWLEVQDCPACPICKAAISRERMLPIYGRGRPHVDPRSLGGERSCASVSESSSIPARPPAASRAPVAASAGEGAAGGSSTAAVATSVLSSAAATAESGFDVMAASLFGLRVVYQVASHPAQARGALSSEEQQQAILSRLLLLLGAFVMVCLLMF